MVNNINLYIEHDERFSININPINSIYSLKEIISNELKNNISTLYFKGLPLNDEKTLLESNIKNNDIIYAHKGLKGGIDTFTVLIFLIYLIFILVFLILLFSGLLPIVSLTYS